MSQPSDHENHVKAQWHTFKGVLIGITIVAVLWLAA